LIPDITYNTKRRTTPIFFKIVFIINRFINNFFIYKKLNINNLFFYILFI
jgi:hypothetical protein